MKVWTVPDGDTTRTLKDATDWVYAVRFSSDGKRLAAGTWDGTIFLWTVADGKLEGKLTTLHPAVKGQQAVRGVESEK